MPSSAVSAILPPSRNAARVALKFRDAIRPGLNTTIAVIATDAVLTKAEAKRLAIAAHDGFSRAIWPAHTPVDGDLVFGLGTAASGIPPRSRSGDRSLRRCRIDHGKGHRSAQSMPPNPCPETCSRVVQPNACRPGGRPMMVRSNLRSSLLGLAITLAAAAPASAGDASTLEVLGFSKDASVFSFEEYGVQDGSAFPTQTLLHRRRS